MKKIIYSIVLLFLISSLASAQKLPFNLKPSVEIILKGAFGSPTSDDDFKNHYQAFPGGQLEVVGNITSNFGVFGNFSVDVLSPKDISVIGATYSQDKTFMVSGSIGPRFYYNTPGPVPIRFFGDLGLGIYGTRPGDETITMATNPPATEKYIYNAYSQMGMNIGAGMNVSLGPLGVVNLTLKYHNLFSKSGVTVLNTKTTSSGTTSGTPQDVASRSYISVAVGIGFHIGL